jgi:hypothetical protein
MKLKQAKGKVQKFKRGDLVTGHDQSYERSIYKFIEGIGGSKNEGIFEIVSYAGTTNEQIIADLLKQGIAQSLINSKIRGARAYAEFRLATWMEIKISSTRSHKKLLNLLNKLGVLDKLHKRQLYGRQ